MKRLIRLIACVSLLCLACCTSGQNGNEAVEVEISTTEGSFKIFLFNETPLHKENFIKLVKNNFYDSVLFHRVIPKFVVQAGDPTTKTSEAKKLYGEESFGEEVPAEFNSKFNHIRGAVGAAREGDNINPDKKSSGSHFYVVLGGNDVTDEAIYKAETKVGEKFSEGVIEEYKSHGGTPHLDGAYTVFGFISEGMDVVDKISTYKTDSNDRPLKDVKILSTKINILTETEKNEKYNSYAK
ncbi:MAG: peptidylprolyl isomerase [Rikenellaceae bacterium]